MHGKLQCLRTACRFADLVACDVRGTQEAPGSQEAEHAKQRKESFQALRTTAKTIALGAPMLLAGLGRDLMTSIVTGSAAQRYIAMEFASLAHGDVRALQLTADDKSNVCHHKSICRMSTCSICRSAKRCVVCIQMKAVAI